MNRCDKCGREVPHDNDAVGFDVCRGGSPLLYLGAVPRHLLPVLDGEEVVCTGSPSRAQYLEGQPRDPRPGSQYDPELEASHREAYTKLLAESQLPR